MSGVGLLVPGSEKCPLAPAAIATRPNPRFHTPDFMEAMLPHGLEARVRGALSPRYPLAMAATPAMMSAQPVHLTDDTASRK